jgi:hypothetical protein
MGDHRLVLQEGAGGQVVSIDVAPDLSATLFDGAEGWRRMERTWRKSCCRRGMVVAPC